MVNFLKKEINIDRRLIVALVMLNFLIMGLYYSYSIFVIKQLKDDFSQIVVKASVIEMTAPELENNRLSLAPNTVLDVNFSLTNSSSLDMYYRIMHKGAPLGVAIYEKTGDGTSFGEIKGNETLNSVITVNNTTDKNITVSFLLQESKNEKFDKDNGLSYVNKVINFDHSGANSPKLPNNMIPVYYESSNDNEEGVWKKADFTNVDSHNIWYDYDNFMWANAVTVNEYHRDEYLNAEPGTEIVKSDISAFFVWIPKYKYYIVSGDGNSSYEKVINVNFLNRDDIERNGTVSCAESISTKENPHLYSEVCSDSTYGSIQNNLSTYLHPAFATEDDGFWIGKFANKNSVNFKILDDSYINLSTTLNNSYARQMLLPDNIYGFNQNNNATYDIATWNYTDGNSELDTHTITSMEWGAVAILTSSSYGKSGNPMYYNDTIKSFTRVYNNASDMYTGRSTKYTLSSMAVGNNDTSVKYYYDLSDVSHKTNAVSYPIGYVGAGASTTGTIYGVYDMAGGNYISVMGVVMNEDGSVPLSLEKINSKYYTAYSYIPYNGKIDSNDKAAYLETFRLGDGIKEHVRTYFEKGMWQDGELIIANSGLMRRGGYTTNGSIYSTEIVNSNSCYGTFTVLKYNPE